MSFKSPLLTAIRQANEEQFDNPRSYRLKIVFVGDVIATGVRVLFTTGDDDAVFRLERPVWNPDTATTEYEPFYPNERNVLFVTVEWGET